ncbi:hypothetical protein [Alloactinosynnema sp. L-07]|uniref:hypothetical protein n=1 Tax=Alloactinosynnema sp. L-07 TaxID=1653480 RepID=UPI00065EF75E|nr:hypothetical protein [Alloactinosynnema sp. L-07]CRK61102.1 hypothetical protein [Alloactinosynnema sp. L-07]
MATGPAAVAVLDALRRVDEASTAARRAVLAGHDPGPALGELVAAVAAITPTAPAVPNPDPSPDAGPAADAARIDCPLAPGARGPVAPARPVAPRSPVAVDPTPVVTESVTDEAPLPRYARRRDVVAPETVLVSKSPRFAIDGTWVITAGAAEDSVLVGFVRQRGFGRLWEAQIAGSGSALRDGPWKTRRQAVNNLLIIGSQVLGYKLR